MRVGIVGLLHESNTFISESTTWEHFSENTLLKGAEVVAKMEHAHHEVGGFIEGLRIEQQLRSDVELVPIFLARAVPYGTITDECYRRLREELLHELRQQMPIDGVLVAPHGATVSEQVRDVDGDWLAAVRAQVGPQVPIIGTLDLHVNLSPQMVEATDALIAYRTNPHLDQRQRGIDAARLMCRTLAGEVRPTQAACFPPLAINIEKQLTEVEPCCQLYQVADEQLREPHVLSNSVCLGFPYADVEEMGSAVLVVTDDSPKLAQQHADALGQHLWDNRDQFKATLIDIPAAIAAAEAVVAERPDATVCLLDMGDNVGGGSPADGTLLLHALASTQLSTAVVLCDPVACQQAATAGIDAIIELSVGGRTDDLHGAPYHDKFRVRVLANGRFREPQPRHGGLQDCDQGLTAVLDSLRTPGVTVMLTSKRMPPFSLRQLSAFGVEPGDYRVLVAKGVNAPVAAYREVCEHFVRVNTPGCTTADMRQLDYSYRRRPLFPFEEQARFAVPPT